MADSPELPSAAIWEDIYQRIDFLHKSMLTFADYENISNLPYWAGQSISQFRHSINTLRDLSMSYNSKIQW